MEKLPENSSCRKGDMQVEVSEEMDEQYDFLLLSKKKSEWEKENNIVQYGMYTKSNCDLITECVRMLMFTGSATMT